MKLTITMLLTLTLCSSLAQAEVYLCRSVNKGGSNLLVALNGDTGIVYSNGKGYFKELSGTTTVARAMDGGPISISVKPNSNKTDWDQNSGCWAYNGTGTNVTINSNSKEKNASYYYSYPNIERNPNRDPSDSNCAPELPSAPPAPRYLNCKLQ
jgi:hypothetical protein